MSESSRGRGERDEERPIRLGRDDKRKLYGLLDADVNTRLRRLELGMVAVLAITGGPLVAGSGLPQTVSVLVAHLLNLNL